MEPLPAVAFELSIVFPPEQKEVVPEIVAVGKAFTVTAKAVDIKEQPLLLEIVIVYNPAEVAVYVVAVAPLIGVPPRFHW